MLVWVKAEPSTPPPMPIRMEGRTAITFTATKSWSLLKCNFDTVSSWLYLWLLMGHHFEKCHVTLEVNLVLKSPKSFLYLNPWKDELSRSVVKVATMQQKKTCQESLFFQKDETSSIAKRRPPTGAPKAEAIPAAAPAEMKLRRSSEFRKREKHGKLHSKVADLNWDMPAATRLPKWIIGPS